MSQTSKANPSKVSLATAVVLYGLDQANKPQAARFPERLCDLAINAAKQLKLNVLKVTTDEIAQVAGRLPVGRVNASGRGLVPSVRQALYDQVLAVAKANGAANASPTSTAPNGFTKIPLNEEGKEGNPAGSDGLPASWKDIAPNHLVLAQESAREGWAEAIVVAKRDDMLTLRWRDYPKWKPFECHVDAVALVNPAPSYKA